MELLAGSVAVLGILVWLWGWLTIQRLPTCHLCKRPMPSGFWAYRDGKPVCRACGRRRKIPPWYARSWQIEHWRATGKFPW